MHNLLAKLLGKIVTLDSHYGVLVGLDDELAYIGGVDEESTAEPAPGFIKGAQPAKAVTVSGIRVVHCPGLRPDVWGAATKDSYTETTED